jgi:[ribosomal protein S5]-alanine N-acetyltransferase
MPDHLPAPSPCPPPTPRLWLRRLTDTDADAAFILTLVNDPDWLQFIGDKDVHTLADALAYIRSGPMSLYARFGFGLWAVALRSTGALIGICGLIKRDLWDDIDLGFALLPEHRRQGYAHEAAQATLAYARDALGLRHVIALVTPENASSIQLLERLGLRSSRMVRLSAEGDEVCLFSLSLDA